MLFYEIKKVFDATLKGGDEQWRSESLSWQYSPRCRKRWRIWSPM